MSGANQRALQNTLKLILISADPVVAELALTAGVDRLMVDLELLGKEVRQSGRNSVVSRHTVADVRRLRRVVSAGALLVRTNPMHTGIRAEIEAVLAAGADQLMLPYFHRIEELQEYCRIVAGRVPVVPLVETPAAIACIEGIVETPGVAEVFVGLNDLHIALGKKFMFELVAEGIVDTVAAAAHRARMPFGFGGIARMGQGIVPGELVLSEHQRVGSSAVILSRTFLAGLPYIQGVPDPADFIKAVRRLREAEKSLAECTSEQRILYHEEFLGIVQRHVMSR